MGDYHVDAAIGRLKEIQLRTAGMMTHYGPRRGTTLAMLFRDDDMEKLRAVRGFVRPANSIQGYQVAEDVTLYIDFEGAVVPTIEPSRLHIQPERAVPLMNFIRDLKAVHDRFEELKGVLRWLNRQATPGAIRYFFPQAMKLVPDSPIWKDLQEVPSRYSTPVDYGVWAQSIRDAANTVAQTMLLPADAAKTEKDNMWLTFGSASVHLDPHDPHKTHYRSDNMTYNI